MTKPVEIDESNESNQFSITKKLKSNFNDSTRNINEHLKEALVSSGEENSIGIGHIFNYSSTTVDLPNSNTENEEVLSFHDIFEDNKDNENLNIYSELNNFNESLGQIKSSRIKIEHVFIENKEKKGDSSNNNSYRNMSSSNSSTSSLISPNSVYSSVTPLGSSSSDFTDETLKRINKKIVDSIMSGLGDKLSSGFKDGWKVKETLIQDRHDNHSENFKKLYGLETERPKSSLTSDSSPNYSTTSSSSSSIYSFNENFTSSYQQPRTNNMKPISLSYYHHIFEQKQNNKKPMPLYRVDNRSILFKQKNKAPIKDLRMNQKNLMHHVSLGNNLNKSLSTINEEIANRSGQYLNSN